MVSIKASIITLMLVFTAFTAHAEDNTYCYDEEALADWQALLNKYHDDSDLRELFYLRGRLCDQVISGDKDHQEALTRFEHARDRLRKKWEEQNRARGLAAGGAG